MASRASCGTGTETLCRLLVPAGRAGGSHRGDDVLAEAARPGLLARVAGEPFLARALPAVVGRLAAGGRLASLAPADRVRAEAVLAFGEERARATRAALLPLGQACAKDRVPALLVKGAALHGLLYDVPAHRPSADVDAFVPARHVARFDAVLTGLGFRAGADSRARIDAFERSGRRGAWLVDLAYDFPRGDGVLEVKADPVGVGQPPWRLEPFEAGATPSPVYPGLLLPSAETMVVQQAMSLARRASPDLLAHAELAGVLLARRAEFDAGRALDLVAGEGLYGVLRGVLSDTAALFPHAVPAALLSRRGRPAGYTPPRIRRGTLAPPLPETGWTRASFWAVQALGNRRPLATARWLLGRLFPPQPLLSLLTDGRTGVGARWARIARRRP
jgi:hypothetical protein